VTDPALFRRSPETLVRNVGSEVLLTAAGHADVDRLSGTAAAVWHVLEVSRPPAEVARLVAEAFGQREQDVLGDVQAFLDELLRRGWVERIAR
jgi:hypothetical protein